MQKLLREYMDELNKRQKKNRRTGIAILVLVVIVFGGVMGILTQYGVAMTGKPLCGLEEHTHTEACYEKTLVCGMEEGEGHTHTEDCLYPAELTCGQEESEGHTHTDDCLYPAELTCGEEETEEHTHDESCYTVPEGYACGKEETEGHTHDESCYTVPEGYACGKEETNGHTHTDECYEETLACGKEEHIHTDACYIDTEADVEDPAAWDQQYADVQWKNAWGEDLTAAAQMQLGYHESTDNYTVAEDGSHKGYTRYGHLAGDIYADWDALFVNFCLHYAGLEESGMFPAETLTSDWYEKFVTAENGKYNAYVTTPENYTPVVGDLVFFQKENEETVMQMGIVSAVNEENRIVTVIEGNNGNEVKETEYALDDASIVKFLMVSEAEKAYKNQDVEEEDKAENSGEENTDRIITADETLADETQTEAETRTLEASGTDYTVTVTFTEEAGIPENAVLDVREIEAGSEEYLQYYNQSLEEMGAEELSFARYFDITFLVDGEKIEPAASVEVKISYTDTIVSGEDEARRAIHFAEEGTEVLGVEEEENAISFLQDSFSVDGDIMLLSDNVDYHKIEVTDIAELDGKEFLIANTRGVCYMSPALYGDKPDGVSGIYEKNVTKDQFSAGEENVWKFTRVGETNTFFIFNANIEQYLDIISAHNSTQANLGFVESEPSQSFTVEMAADGTGRILISKMVDGVTYYINAYGQNKFAGWYDEKKDQGQSDEGNKLTLFIQRPIMDQSFEIEDNIINDGTLRAKLETFSEILGEAKNNGTQITYEWQKSVNWNDFQTVENQTFENGYSVTNSDDEEEKWINIALDGGALNDSQWSVDYRLCITIGEEENAEKYYSNVIPISYYSEIQNGSFEKPEVSGYYGQYTMGTENLYWKTTAPGTGNNTGKDIEIVRVNDNKIIGGYFYDKQSHTWSAAEGSQFAELNCEAIGALYQDVLTVRGSVLNYSFAHRKRDNSGSTKKNEEGDLVDVMYVLIVPTKVAIEGIKDEDFDRGQDTTKEIDTKAEVDWLINHVNDVDGDGNKLYPGVYCQECEATVDEWTMHDGTYIPEYNLTRFFFVSAAEECGSQGNFIDKISFSQKLPEPKPDSFTFRIRKDISGISDEELEELREKLVFSIDIKDSKRESVQLENIPNMLKASDMTLSKRGESYILIKDYMDIPMGNSNNYTITVTENSGELDFYQLSTTVTRMKNNKEEEKISDVTGSVDVAKKDTARLIFENTYAQQYTWQMVKCSSSLTEDKNKLFLAGAEFELKLKNETEDSNSHTYTGTSADDGVITWKDSKDNVIETLPNGIYTVTEIKAPAGYSIAGSWDIAFTNGKPEIEQNIGADVEISEMDNGSYTVYLKNDPLYELPSTGGSGIYWYIFGGILLMSAGTLILYKNKMRGGAGRIG